jgi:hypothetical protein
MAAAAEWPTARVREFVLNGVDGAWLDEADRRSLRAEFERELDALEAQLEPAGR